MLLLRTLRQSRGEPSSQIGRKPINDKSVEREVYALSSGIALGLVNLGAGPELHVQFGDLNIDKILHRIAQT